MLTKKQQSLASATPPRHPTETEHYIFLAELYRVFSNDSGFVAIAHIGLLYFAYFDNSKLMAGCQWNLQRPATQHGYFLLTYLSTTNLDELL